MANQNQSNLGKDSNTTTPTSTTSTSQNSKKELLTFVLPASTKGGEDKHALVLLPKTYDEAVTSAIHALGLVDVPSNIILRCYVQTGQHAWVWANIQPENWQLLVSSGDSIGVFEKISVLKGTEHFLHGKVCLSFGKHKSSHNLAWSDVADTQGNPDLIALVRRPSTLTDAIKIIRSALSENPWFYRVENLVKDWTNEDWNKATPKIKFYRFINRNYSTAVYQELPSLAYTNDDAWRTVVPLPGEVLGVVLPSKSEF